MPPRSRQAEGCRRGACRVARPLRSPKARRQAKGSPWVDTIPGRNSAEWIAHDTAAQIAAPAHLQPASYRRPPPMSQNRIQALIRFRSFTAAHPQPASGPSSSERRLVISPVRASWATSRCRTGPGGKTSGRDVAQTRWPEGAQEIAADQAQMSPAKPNASTPEHGHRRSTPVQVLTAAEENPRAGPAPAGACKLKRSLTCVRPTRGRLQPAEAALRPARQDALGISPGRGRRRWSGSGRRRPAGPPRPAGRAGR